MSSLSVKQLLITALVLFGIIVLTIFGLKILKTEPKVTEIVTQPVDSIENKEPLSPFTVIGNSVEGRAIELHSFGTGRKHLLFVGGIHGGYEWNSVLLAYTFIDYFNANPNNIPSTLTVDIIPDANPDGVYKVTHKDGRFSKADVSTDTTVLASGRFNARLVDLNRNFDCKWKSKSTWQSKTVSAGTAPFSEPESTAIKKFIISTPPVAVVFWHSKANGVYASQCTNGILPDTLDTMILYSQASKYPSFKTFDAYETTGAADDWLSTVNIPAITVELETHENIEWERNLAGIKSLIEHYK